MQANYVLLMWSRLAHREKLWEVSEKEIEKMDGLEGGHVLPSMQSAYREKPRMLAHDLLTLQTWMVLDLWRKLEW